MDADDRYHAVCRNLLETHPGPLVVPLLTITEVAYLLATRLGTAAEVRFLGDVSSGAFSLAAPRAAEWLRIAELVFRYSDLPLGTVDASIIALTERLEVSAVATLDRRHFTVVRPMHTAAFDLLP